MEANQEIPAARIVRKRLTVLLRLSAAMAKPKATRLRTTTPMYTSVEALASPISSSNPQLYDFWSQKEE